MTSIRSAGPDTFGVLLPDGWEVLPLDMPGFVASVRSAREGLRAQDGWKRSSERAFELMMDSMRSELLAADVRWAASMARLVTVDEPGEPEATPEDPQVEFLTASCAIAIMRREALGLETSLSANTLMLAVTGTDGGDDEDALYTDLEPPQFEDLPAGRAVFLRRLQKGTDPKRPLDEMSLYLQTYLLPIGQTGDEAVMIAFATPATRHARGFSRLFASMAQTFRVFEGDEPARLWHDESDA